MPTELIPPALTPEEWKRALDPNRSPGRNGKAQLSPHGAAALALYGQPFGFSYQDVDDEDEVAVYCEQMAEQRSDAAATFRVLAERHRLRARKIEALLPPRR